MECTHIHYLCMLNHLFRNVCGGKIRKKKERKKNRARNFRKGPKTREIFFYSYRLIFLYFEGISHVYFTIFLFRPQK